LVCFEAVYAEEKRGKRHKGIGVLIISVVGQLGSS
jgi:hypothetical protein